MAPLPLVMIVYVVPPRIFHDEEEVYYTGNTIEAITVPFQSRFMVNTIVSWEKNDLPLSGFDVNEQQSPPNSTTKLILDPARRNDSGKYRIAVENRFSAIPRDLQVAYVCLTVRVFGKLNVLLAMVVRGVGIVL